jgi:alpha-1,2-mannosyltransferase
MSTVVSAMSTEPAAPCFALELMRRTGLASGTLYASLVHLERAGWVTSAWDDARPNGTRRRRYALTTPGSASETVIGITAETGARRLTAHAGKVLTPAGWLVAAVIAAVQTTNVLSRPASRRLPDLGVYMGAVTDLRHGHSLYGFVTAGGAPFTYPPFAGLVFWPLTFIARAPLQVVWTVATVATVAVLAVVAARATGVSAPLVAVALILSAPVSSDMRFGQVSLGLAVLVTIDVVALRAKRCQGVMVGIAAAIKLTPLIFIPLLWRAGQRRAAFTATATFAACALLAYAILPADSRRFWGVAMWHVERLGYITSAANQSLDGAMMRLGLTDPARSLAVLVAATAVVAFALRRARWSARSGDWMSAVVIVGAASVVVSPVSWTHHQVWLVMAALLPVSGSLRVRTAWACAVLLVMTLPVTTVGTAVGWPLLEDARLVVAVCVACVVPLVASTHLLTGGRSDPCRSRALRSATGEVVPRLLPQ